MRPRPIYFISIVTCLLLSGCTTHYFLVRHAERLDDSSDTPLSAEGLNRAEALRDRLLAEDIDSIFATPYLRTQQTVQPLADALNKPVVIYGTDSTYQFVRDIRKIRGKEIAIAGHSNTIPEMILYFTGDSVYIDHDDYDNLFIVQLKRTIYGKKITLTRTTYGELSP